MIDPIELDVFVTPTDQQILGAVHQDEGLVFECLENGSKNNIGSKWSLYDFSVTLPEAGEIVLTGEAMEMDIITNKFKGTAHIAVLSVRRGLLSTFKYNP